MTSPLLRYARLRGRATWNLLTRSGVPWPVTFALAAFTVLAMLQFSRLMGVTLGKSHDGGPVMFASVVGLVFCVFQLVFAFVSIGSISIRLFDPRRVAEVDLFAALPLRRIDRFLMQVSDVALIPAGMIAGVVCPAMVVAAVQARMALLPSVLLVVLGGLVAFQPVPALVAIYAGLLRAAPAWLLRRRSLLFVLFALAVMPLVPILGDLLTAWKLRQGPAAWLPAAWAANAVAAAETGDLAGAARHAAAVVATTAVLGLAAYLAYDRAFMDRFDEVLAKLQASALPEDDATVTGRDRRAVETPRLHRDRVRATLLRKEIIGYARDPALQLTMAGMGATAFTFAGSALLGLAPYALAVFAVAGIGFLAIYLAACLGLASFTLEGRGLPVLAPLPLAVDEVLRSKLVANTGLLVAAGAIAGAALGLTVEPGPGGLLLAPLLAVLAAAVCAPLGALVTAMGALFPRRLHRTGRREISILAMSFFTALTGLFYLSMVAALAAPVALGFRFLWVPAVVMLAWSCVSASLVAGARKAVRLASTEG